MNLTEELVKLREAIADLVEQSDVPIDIIHWMGTKRELSRQTGLAIVQLIRAFPITPEEIAAEEARREIIRTHNESTLIRNENSPLSQGTVCSDDADNHPL